MAEEYNFVEKPLEVSPALLRQRRNLLIAAVVFLLVRVGGATIQGVSIGGNSIRFERPGVLLLALWVITIYWLLRYSVEGSSRCRLPIRGKSGHSWELAVPLNWCLPNSGEAEKSWLLPVPLS